MTLTLKKGGGKEENFDNQVDRRNLDFAQGWGKYTTKQIAKMQAHTGDSCFAMSTACKAIRESLQAAKHIVSKLRLNLPV